MKSIIGTGIIGILLTLTVSSCSHTPPTPEAFCQSWVSSTCAALTLCCAPGMSYDVDQCQVTLSGECQQALALDMVQSGERVFNAGAAASCFGTVSNCAIAGPSEASATYAQAVVCADVITGYIPIGGACSSADECQRSGDASTCYDGSGTAGGVCAGVVLGSTTCSFSFTTNQLTVCPDGTFCNRMSLTPNPNATPEQQAYEFSAPCTPYLTAGAICASGAQQTGTCGPGLLCTIATMGATMATCVAAKPAGEACTGNDCAAGLECLPAKGAAGETCQAAGSFCYAPCGAVGQTCCASATPCTSGTCEAGVCVTGTCGGIGESCCNGVTCATGTCEGGLCVSTTCGEIGESCCNGVTCDVGSCEGGVCVSSTTCGEIGESCCNGVTCNTGTCDSGICDNCGEIGETCCNGTDCTTGTCNSGICEASTVDCTCACETFMAAGGCADECSTNFDGSSTPNFCEGVFPLSQCETCLLTNCSGTPIAAGTCTGM